MYPETQTHGIIYYVILMKQTCLCCPWVLEAQVYTHDICLLVQTVMVSHVASVTKTNSYNTETPYWVIGKKSSREFYV